MDSIAEWTFEGNPKFSYRLACDISRLMAAWVLVHKVDRRIEVAYGVLFKRDVVALQQNRAAWLNCNVKK